MKWNIIDCYKFPCVIYCEFSEGVKDNDGMKYLAGFECFDENKKEIELPIPAFISKSKYAWKFENYVGVLFASEILKKRNFKVYIEKI